MVVISTRNLELGTWASGNVRLQLADTPHSRTGSGRRDVDGAAVTAMLSIHFHQSRHKESTGVIACSNLDAFGEANGANCKGGTLSTPAPPTRNHPSIPYS